MVVVVEGPDVEQGCAARSKQGLYYELCGQVMEKAAPAAFHNSVSCSCKHRDLVLHCTGHDAHFKKRFPLCPI